MTRLAFAVLLALAAASPAAAQTRPAAKPAAPFDARDPAALAALLTGMGAKAGVGRASEGLVSVDVTTPGGAFGVQFVNCNGQGKACEGLAFSTAFQSRAPTLAHLNIFNRTQIACRGYLSEDGKPNVMYSTILTARISAEDMKRHVGVWQGCLATFQVFTADPAGFLANQD